MRWFRSVIEARRRGWLRPRVLLRAVALLPLYVVGYGLVAVGYPFLVLSFTAVVPLFFLFNAKVLRKDPKQVVWVLLGTAKIAALFFPFFAVPYLLAHVYRPGTFAYSPADPPATIFLIATAAVTLVWALLSYGLDAFRKLGLALQMRGTATSRIRSMAAGLVELHGTVRGLAGDEPVIRYSTQYQPQTTHQQVSLFVLHDESGRAVIDAREAEVQPRWGTGNGEHVREILLQNRVTAHTLTTPEVQELRPGDTAYVLAYHDPAATMEIDGEMLPLIRPRNAPERATGWRTILSSPGARENWSFAHAFLLTDGDETTARKVVRRAGLVSAVRSLVYVLPAMAMLVLSIPYTTGYDRWSVANLETNAPREKRAGLLAARARAGDIEALRALARHLDDAGAGAAFPGLVTAAPVEAAVAAIAAAHFDRAGDPEALRPMLEHTYFRASLAQRLGMLWTFVYAPFDKGFSPLVFHDALMQPALRDEALRALEYANLGHAAIEGALEQVARDHRADYRLESAARLLRRSRGANGTVRFLLSLATDPPAPALICAVAALLPVSEPTEALFRAGLTTGASESCLADGLAAQPRSSAALRWFAARLTAESWTVSSHAHAYVRAARAGARSLLTPYWAAVSSPAQSDARLFETLRIVYTGDEQRLAPFLQQALRDSRAGVRREAAYSITQLGERATFMREGVTRALSAEPDEQVRRQLESALRKMEER